MNSAFSTLGARELEVFDRSYQRLVEQLARWADERGARAVLMVAGLLANGHYPR